jgi:hypothetical protein
VRQARESLVVRAVRVQNSFGGIDVAGRSGKLGDIGECNGLAIESFISIGKQFEDYFTFITISV